MARRAQATSGAAAPRRLDFVPVDERAARAVLAWRYEGPWAFYNADPAGLEEDVKNLSDPRSLYFAAADARGRPAAYFCFGREARVPGGDYSEDALDVGCGLRPDLTGRGTGAEFIRAGLEFARERFGARAFRATVAAFNARALRACEKAGFRRARTFRAARDGEEFVILLLES